MGNRPADSPGDDLARDALRLFEQYGEVRQPLDGTRHEEHGAQPPDRARTVRSRVRVRVLRQPVAVSRRHGPTDEPGPEPVVPVLCLGVAGAGGGGRPRTAVDGHRACGAKGRNARERQHGAPAGRAGSPPRFRERPETRQGNRPVPASLGRGIPDCRNLASQGDGG